MSPNISVIVPTTRRDARFTRCLHALTNQTYPQKEYEVIIVVNHNPRLFTELKKQRHGYRLIHETKLGLMHARHAGARVARAKILAFIDDDAIADKEWIARLMDAYKRYPQAVAVGGKITLAWDHHPPTWIKSHEWLLGKLDLGKKELFGNNFYLNGANFSIYKPILTQVGGFEPDQIGDRVYGSGEAGLVHRLREAGYNYVYSPQAVVTHLQCLAKNGTRADLKRRYQNHAVSDYSLELLHGSTQSHTSLLIRDLYRLGLNSLLYAGARLFHKEEQMMLREMNCYYLLTKITLEKRGVQC